MSLPDASLIESLAAALHENYRREAHKQGWPLQPEVDRPYADLAENWKDANRAAARRIPEVLAVIGVALVPSSQAQAHTHCTQAQLAARIAADIERLAEAEHDGWVHDRLQRGWQYGPTRDDAHKIHPSLVPFAELSEQDREKDRTNVRGYPELIASLADVVPVTVGQDSAADALEGTPR